MGGVDFPTIAVRIHQKLLPQVLGEFTKKKMVPDKCTVWKKNILFLFDCRYEDEISDIEDMFLYGEDCDEDNYERFETTLEADVGGMNDFISEGAPWEPAIVLAGKEISFQEVLAQYGVKAPKSAPKKPVAKSEPPKKAVKTSAPKKSSSRANTSVKEGPMRYEVRAKGLKPHQFATLSEAKSFIKETRNKGLTTSIVELI